MSDCRYFDSDHCRSCGLLDRSYPEQLLLKHQKLSSLLTQFLGYDLEVAQLIPSATQFGSRNKAKLVVSGTVQNPIVGLLDSEFKGKELLECPLHAASINVLAQELNALITSEQLPPYNVESRKGELKYIILRAAQGSGELTLRFVCRSRELLPKLRVLTEKLQKKHNDLTVVTVNIQPVPHSFVEGKEELFLSTKQFVNEKIGLYEFTISPQSFTQVTPNVAEKLYGFVENIVSEIAPRVLFDLFCGIGGFSLHCSKYAEQVIGVEIAPSSIADAQRSADLNKIKNIRFIRDDAETVLVREAEKGVDCVIVNPPRRGLGPRLIEQLLKLSIPKIIYSSCNPETLARDLAALDKSYTISTIQPFDMFPLTEHFETVAVLSR